MCSALPEDAEEASRKLNKKEFFGKIVTVEIAKPKKRVARPSEPNLPKPLSESKKEEKEVRLRTIIIFGLNRQMSLSSVQRKFRQFISPPNDANLISWPCVAPFSSDTLSYGDMSSSSHPVAHLTISPDRLSSIKEVRFGPRCPLDCPRLESNAWSVCTSTFNNSLQSRKLRKVSHDHAKHPLPGSCLSSLWIRSPIRVSTLSAGMKRPFIQC